MESTTRVLFIGKSCTTRMILHFEGKLLKIKYKNKYHRLINKNVSGSIFITSKILIKIIHYLVLKLILFKAPILLDEASVNNLL